MTKEIGLNSLIESDRKIEGRRDKFECTILACHRVISEIFRDCKFVKLDGEASIFQLGLFSSEDFTIEPQIRIIESKEGKVGVYATTLVKNVQFEELLGEEKCTSLTLSICENYDCILMELDPGEWEIKADLAEHDRDPDELYQIGEMVLEKGGEKPSHSRKDNQDNDYIEKLTVALMGLVSQSFGGAETFITLIDDNGENGFTS